MALTAAWWQLPATLCRDSGGTVAPGGVRAPPRLHLDILQQKRTCFGRTKRSGAQHVEERRMPSLANVVVVGWHKNQVARASSGGRWKEHHLHNMYSSNTLRESKEVAAGVEVAMGGRRISCTMVGGRPAPVSLPTTRSGGGSELCLMRTTMCNCASRLRPKCINTRTTNCV